MKQTVYTLLYLMALLLAVPQTAAAQQKAAQDALYIFRNDGGFNAFFFRDIDHFEYSKVDTLGVEHDDYVTQEIHALDSVFRIPISAIDSVAFVTPETKYRADAFVAQANLVDYVIASDSSTWFRVKKETPAGLLPKVGDKLLIEQSCDLLPGGFSGKVTALDQATDGITVRTERISLTEVYEQYVWKFDGSQLQPEDATRTRAADDDKITGNAEGSISLSGARTLAKSDVGPWEAKLAGETSGSLGYDVSWDLDVRAFLHVSAFTGVQFDATLKGDLAGDFNLEMQAAITSSFEQKLKGFKCDGANVSVGVFLSLSAAIGISSEWKTAGEVYGLAYLHDYLGDKNDKEDVRVTGKVTKSELNILNGNVGKLSASTGLYAKAEFGVSGNTLTVRTELGAATGIDHDINLGDLANLNFILLPSAVIVYPSDLYKAMDRDATLSSNAFFNASISYEVGKYEGTFKREFPFFKSSKTGGWVPHVEGTAFKRDEALLYEGEVKTNLSRNHILDGIVQPIQVGYLTLDEKQNVIDDYWTSYFDGRKTMSRTLDMLEPGAFYSVIPQVKLWGISMLTGDSVKVTLGPAKMELEPRLVEAEREHDFKDVVLKSNIKKLEVKPKADWLTCEEFMSFNHDDNSVTGRVLSVRWEDMPADVYDRRGRIDVIGYNQKGDVILEDSVIVVQHEDVLEYAPKSIEAEAKGGTFTVNITKTNLTDLSVSSDENFCKATLKDNVITVTISENTTAEKRFASVTIKGKNTVGKERTTFFEVSQAAGEGTGPGVDTRTVTQKAFCGKWRKLDDVSYALTTLIINDDLSYEQKQVCIEDYSDGWHSYKKGKVMNDRRMFGKFEFWNPDNWTELPKEYLPDDLKEYDKGYHVGYKQIDRKVADITYGKWLSGDNSATMMGYFEISPDYKYMVENNRYLWMKMDENDPLYPEPYMNYADPANLFLSDSVAYVSNLRTEPDRMKYDRFWISREVGYLKDIQVTPDESFIHIESVTEDGTIYYSFDENTSAKKREGHINVQGTWPDGSIGKAVFTIRQHGGRTPENLSKIYVSGGGKSTKTVLKKYVKEDTTTETTEGNMWYSLTATSFTVTAAGSGVKIEASNESNGKKVTFTLSEGFKKSSKANDIVYSQDNTKKGAGMTEVYKGSMKASNVPCYRDTGDKMTIKGTLSDGVTISEANYLHYWEYDKPEEYSSGYQWYFSESNEYVSDPDNEVEIEITWKTDKWER